MNEPFNKEIKLIGGPLDGRYVRIRNDWSSLKVPIQSGDSFGTFTYRPSGLRNEAGIEIWEPENLH